MLTIMKLMQACVLFVLVACLWSTASGLRCYTCNSVTDNSKCKRAVTCPPGSDGCENVVRMENGILRITKRCQQFQACTESSKQNYIQCSPSVQTFLSEDNLEDSRNLPPSVCRSCCNTNLCNKPIFLKEISRVGLRNPGSGKSRTIKLVPSQPSIRDVRVRLLTSDAALITFKDAENHSADFFSVNLIPARRVRIAPIRLTDNTIPGVNFKIPKGAVAFLARSLTAGTQYRISVVSRKNKGATYSQRILKSFVTMPRKPRRIRVKSVSVNSLRLFIKMPKNAGRVSYYSMSYRKAGAPPSATRKLPNFNTPRMQIIRSLAPSTTYIVSAWTNVAGAQGRLLGSSAHVNLTVRTAVPAVKEIVIRRVHATSITWSWRLPYYATSKTQNQFVVTVRDDTNGLIVVDTAVPSKQRRFTAKDLTPQTAYTFSIRARSQGKNSIAKYSDPVFTLLRCYSCHEAISRDECDQYIECPANSGGCLNEVRRRSFTNTNSREPEWYRASLKCKQVTACNNSELQDERMQCKPNQNRNVDPPEVCRCCCEGDLCNGPSGSCGHILGWLDPFRSPEKPVSTVPPFCPEPDILHGSFVCTSGESEQEIGSQCTFTCEKEYYLVGEAKLNCFDNGQWNVPYPICLPRKTCTEIPESEGTILTCTNGFTSGSVCTAACKSGYLSFAADAIRCELTGEWSSTIFPTCVEEDNCQPKPCQNGATCHDLANNYECECLEGWTGRNCETEVFCTLLFAPENGDLQCTNANRFGSRCRYTCEKGYEQHGSTYTRCSADGYWTAFEPTVCVVKTCKVLPQSLINGGRAQCTGYEYGDECQFSCPDGLSIAGGPANITCQDNKQWSGNVPCCDLQCPPHAKVDLYFLLDSSSSVGSSNWNRLINFTIALLDQFVIDSDNMVVGVGRYNRKFDQRSEISFGEYRDADDLKRKIRSLPYNGQGTKTGRALWNLRFSSLKAAGNRPGIPDIVMVITDGRASDNVEVPARAIKAVKETKIYAIGVVNQFYKVNYTQLAQIASGPEYMQIIKDGYEELARKFSKTLTADVCWIPCQYQYEQREVLMRQRQVNALDGDAIDEEYWTGVDRNRTAIAVEPTRTNRPLIDPHEPEVQRATLDETVSSQVKKNLG